MLLSLFGKTKPAAAQDTPPAATATLPPPPPSPPVAVASLASASASSSSASSSSSTTRSIKQLGLFFAGAGFLVLSTTLTRRSVARKQLAAQLKFYSPSGTGTLNLGERAAAAEGAAATGSGSSASEAAAAQATREDAPHGSFLAAEALNLATLNVVSFFMMITGGVAWALDLSSVGDLRTRVQQYTRGPALDGSTGTTRLTDEEADREVEEWAARILNRRKGGDETKK